MKRFVIGAIVAFFTLPVVAADVILEGCDKLTFDKGQGSSCQVLKGNVRFRQENAVMYCDSAYFYTNQNSFDAFGNVRVIQDSTTLTANKMFYDGNTKLMRIREDITMNSGQMTLTTQKLDFFRAKNYAFYDSGAKIVDPSFTLTSQVGYYYPGSKKAVFKGHVDLQGTDYKILTDTLTYNSRSSEATVLGPSTIYRGRYVITTSNAYMHNSKGEFRLYERSVVESDDNTQRIVADTILYDRSAGVAHLYGNVDVHDFNQHMAMCGGYAEMNQQPYSHGYLTKNAYVKEFSTADTLFLRADTLKFATFADSTRQVDGVNNVRFFRSDFQGKSDNMKFFSKDSMMYMDGNPVLWADANQLTGDTVYLYLKNKRPDLLHIIGNSLVIQRDDSVNFNQLKGNELFGYFAGNNLRKVLMKGNAMSVYYPKDKHGDLIGVNHNIGSQMTIFISEDRKLEKILLEPGTEGTMYPPFEAPREVLFLKGFSWLDEVRPHSPLDIFSLNN